MDPFENAVFMLSCGRVKTELFENADVTASIYDPSEPALGSLGITRGYFAYLFSDLECHSDFVLTGIISKAVLWTWIFFIRIKKVRFQKYPYTCGRGLKRQSGVDDCWELSDGPYTRPFQNCRPLYAGICVYFISMFARFRIHNWLNDNIIEE